MILRRVAVQVVAIIGFVVMWEVISRTGWLFEGIFPSMVVIIVKMGELLLDAAFWAHFWVSGREIVYGFLIGSVLGVASGGLIGRIRILRETLEPLLFYLGAIPKIVFLPMFLWFLGVGLASKAGMAAFSAYFPITISVILAVSQVEPIYVEAGRSLRANKFQIWTKIYLPGSIGVVLNGAKLGIGVAI